MSDERWQNVKSSIDQRSMQLGPYFAHQARGKPRHLLFTLARYKFAARLLPESRPLEVLELGCNEGLGSVFLVEHGHRLTAVDFDDAAIEHAKETLADSGIDFRHDDFLGKQYGSFDAVISLDVIEHIAPQREAQFMATVMDNLSAHGMCLLGTPNASAQRFASDESRLGHVNLYEHLRLSDLMHRHFHQSFLFGMNDEVVHTGYYPMCHYLLALGCCPRSEPLVV